MWALHVDAPTRLVDALVGQVVDGGRIVLVGSRTMTGVAGKSQYAATKSAQIGLTRSWAMELSSRGITVNVVAPGPILTHHLQRAGERAQQLAATAVPMGRIGTIDDVAHAVLWLCSDEAAFITGVTLPIDGGQTAGHKPPQMYRQGESMSAPTPVEKETP